MQAGDFFRVACRGNPVSMSLRSASAGISNTTHSVCNKTPPDIRSEVRDGERWSEVERERQRERERERLTIDMKLCVL